MSRLRAAVGFVSLIANSAFGQYYVETYAGRLGQATGDVALSAVIDAQGLALGGNENLLYQSTLQVVEIDQTGVIGRVLGPNDLRFDLADSGSRYYYLAGITSDAQGNIYLLDSSYFRVLKIDPAGMMSALSVPVRAALSARLAAGSDGVLYLAATNSLVQKIDFAAGTTTSVAGIGRTGTSPAADGMLATSVAIKTTGIAIDAMGTLFFTDGNLIRRIDDQGRLVTVLDLSKAGTSGTVGPLSAAPNGTLLVSVGAQIYRVDPASGKATNVGAVDPIGPTVGIAALIQDTNGNVLVSQRQRITMIDGATGLGVRFAGIGQSSSPSDPAPATTIKFSSLTTFAAAPDGTLYIPELQARRIRTVDPVTKMTRSIAAFGGYDVKFDGLPGFSLSYTAIAVDGQANVIYNEFCRVQRMNPVTGETATIAGSTSCGDAMDGIAAQSNHFGNIYAVTVDKSNNLYILDDSVWKIDATTGITSRVISSDDLLRLNVNYPQSGNFLYTDNGHLAVDASGNVYVNHLLHGAIAKAAPDGSVTIFAGDGGFLLDGSFNQNSLLVEDMAIGDDGALYLAQGKTVSRLDLGTGVMTRIAGVSDRPDLPSYSGDGGQALSAIFQPTGIAIGGGNIFVADSPVVRRLYVPAQSVPAKAEP